MTLEWLGNLWSIVQKGSGPFSLALGLVAASYLWIPQLGAIGAPEWRPKAGVALLAAAVVVLAHAIESVRGAWRRLRSARDRVDAIRTLPPQSLAVLGALLQHEVLRMDLRDGPVDLVWQLGLVSRSDVSHGGFAFDFTLRPWVRAHLLKDDSILATAAPTLDKVKVFDRTAPW